MLFNGKEYTEEQVASMLAQQEEFIDKLKTEKVTLEGQVTEMASKAQQSLTLEQALSLFQQGQQQQPSPEQPAAQPEPIAQPDPVASPQPQIDVAALVAEQVRQTLAKQQAEASHEQNLLKSMEMAKQFYGDDYATKLEAQAAKVNLDTEGVMQLAKTNPALFEQSLMPKQQPVMPAPNGQQLGYHSAPAPQLNDIVVDFGDTDKYWNGASKVAALQDMERQVAALIENGDIQL